MVELNLRRKSLGTTQIHPFPRVTSDIVLTIFAINLYKLSTAVYVGRRDTSRMIPLKPMPRPVNHRNKRQHHGNLNQNAHNGGQRGS